MHDRCGGWGRSQLLPQNSITYECKLLYVPMLGLYHFTQLARRRGNSFILLSSLRQMDGYINPKIDNVKISSVATSKQSTKRPYPLSIIITLYLFLTTRNQQHPPMHHVRWTIWWTLSVCGWTRTRSDGHCVCGWTRTRNTFWFVFPIPKQS